MAGSSPGRRVLIVDDAPEMRQLLSLALNLQGYLVAGQAEDGATAVRLAAEEQPDLVILDARMPRTSGIQALPDILRAAPGAKVVVFSADPPDRMEATALSAGAHAYVDKVDGVFGVLDAFERLLEGANKDTDSGEI